MSDPIKEFETFCKELIKNYEDGDKSELELECAYKSASLRILQKSGPRWTPIFIVLAMLIVLLIVWRVKI